MKRILSIIISLIMVISLSPANIFAAENETQKEDIITLEEYTNALKEAYAKYDAEFDIVEYDETIPLTQSMLDEELKKVGDIKIYCLDSGIIPSLDLNISGIDSGIMRAMPVQRSVWATWTITPGWIYPSYANMRTDVDVTIDAANNNVISVDSYDHTVTYGLNFASWTGSSTTITKNSPSAGYITVKINGKAVFEYTNPTTGNKHTTTYNVKNFTLNPIKCY